MRRRPPAVRLRAQVLAASPHESRLDVTGPPLCRQRGLFQPGKRKKDRCGFSQLGATKFANYPQTEMDIFGISAALGRFSTFQQRSITRRTVGVTCSLYSLLLFLPDPEAKCFCKQGRR